MKKYEAPLVSDGQNVHVKRTSIAGMFLAGALAALGGSALKGDKIITPGLTGLEPCID